MIRTILLYSLIFSSAWGLEPLLSTSQVAASINNPKVVIVDVSEDDVYALEGHIHGAVHTKISEWRKPIEKHMSVKSAVEIQQLMRRLGINDDSEVIVYSHLNTPKELLASTYVLWAMKLHGIKEIALMEGGIKAWSAEKRFVLHEDSSVKEGTFTAKLNPLLVTDISHVRQNIGKVPMIDARPAENYFGLAKSDGVERTGHITGAMSYFWMYSLTPDFALKPLNELKSVFAEGFGLRPEQEIIVYCTGGLETSFNFFLLSEVLGYKNVRLYDGSMREWGNLSDAPMVRYKWEQYKGDTEVIR